MLEQNPELTDQAIKQILDKSKAMRSDITKMIYEATKNIDKKQRSELVIDQKLEDALLHLGANSFKEAKHTLRNELIEDHADRFIDNKKAPADKNMVRWMRRKIAEALTKPPKASFQESQYYQSEVQSTKR